MKSITYMKKKNKLIQKHFNTDLELVPKNQIVECKKVKLTQVGTGTGTCPYCKVYIANDCDKCPMDKADNYCNTKGSTYSRYVALYRNASEHVQEAYFADLQKLMDKYNKGITTW